MITSTSVYAEKYRYQESDPEKQAIERILHGELSAVDAYSKVVKSLAGDPDHVRLLDLMKFHEDMVSHWETRLQVKGGGADDSTTVWRLFVEAFVGTSKLFGNTTALDAMLRGEEYGYAEYNRMLENEKVSFQDKKFVREKVIPRMEFNVNSIKAMLKMQN